MFQIKLFAKKPKVLCIGYNSVYNPKTPKAPLDNLLDPDEQAYATDRPDGVRLWTWLILCYDGTSPSPRFCQHGLNPSKDTVISIHENPSQESLDSLNVQDKDEALKNMKALKYTRGNFLNAFRQLSKINDSSVKTNPIMKLSIRLGSQTPQSSVTPASDAPGLLFYYLFDDWYASYSLVAREEHQYGAKLEDVVSSLAKPPYTANRCLENADVPKAGCAAYSEAPSHRTAISCVATDV